MGVPRRNPRRAVVAGLVWQAALLAALAVLAWWLIDTTADNLRLRGIPSGFGFLGEPAGFAIGEGLIDFDSAMPYWRAFVAGLANTLRVAVPAMVAAVVIGALLGLGRQSRNLLLRAACRAYVELFRNLPLLLQLLAWYFVLGEWLPPLADAWQPVAGVFVSKSGIALPLPGFGPLLDVPQFRDGTLSGGASLTPEFLALFLGLTFYTAAYLGESVRAGIESVPVGQREAAESLGLTRGQVWRRVVLPQALPAIVPPATNQLLNLLKNSSLAVAIGYPDLVSVANTTLNQTGRAVECIAIVMAVYFLLSLAVSWLTGRHGRQRGEAAWTL